MDNKYFKYGVFGIILLLNLIVVNGYIEDMYFESYDYFQHNNTENWVNNDTGYILRSPWSGGTNGSKSSAIFQGDRVHYIGDSVDLRVFESWNENNLDALCIDIYDDGNYQYCLYNTGDGCGGGGCPYSECADQTTGTLGVPFLNHTGCDFSQLGDCFFEDIICPGCDINTNTPSAFYVDFAGVYNCSLISPTIELGGHQQFHITDWRKYSCLNYNNFTEKARYNTTSNATRITSTGNGVGSAIINCYSDSFCDATKTNLWVTGRTDDISYPCSWNTSHACGVGYDLNDDGNYNNDCSDNSCYYGVCGGIASCFDGLLSPTLNETDVDYGGEWCGYCEDNSNALNDIVWQLADKDENKFDFDRCNEEKGSLLWVIFLVMSIVAMTIIVIMLLISIFVSGTIFGFIRLFRKRRKKKDLNR